MSKLLSGPGWSDTAERVDREMAHAYDRNGHQSGAQRQAFYQAAAEREQAVRAAWAAAVKLVGWLIVGAVLVWGWFAFDQWREETCRDLVIAHNEMVVDFHMDRPLRYVSEC